MEASLSLALTFSNPSPAAFAGECLSIDTRPVDVDDVPEEFKRAYEALEFIDDPDAVVRENETTWLIAYDTIKVQTEVSMLREYGEPYLRAGAEWVIAAVDYADYDGGDEDFYEDNKDDDTQLDEDEGACPISNRTFFYKACLLDGKLSVEVVNANGLRIPDDLTDALRMVLDKMRNPS